MSKNLEIKKQVVSDIVKKFQDAQSVIVVKLQRPVRGSTLPPCALSSVSQQRGILRSEEHAGPPCPARS